MSEKVLYELINPPFTFRFADKEYELRKASIEKGIQYQAKVRGLLEAKDPAQDLKLAVYCIYLMLKDIDPAITEEFVLQNCPADLDVIDCLTQLGFMNPQRTELAKKVQKNMENRLTSEGSSPT